MHVALTLEAWLALASVLILILPTIVVWRAWARVRSRRLALAGVGFCAFLATDLAILLAQVFAPDLSDSLEWLEFTGDVATASAFALAFLWREPPGA